MKKVFGIILVIASFNAFAEEQVIVDNKYVIPKSKLAEFKQYEAEYKKLPVTGYRLEPRALSRNEVSVASGAGVGVVAAIAGAPLIIAAGVGGIAGAVIYNNTSEPNQPAPVEERKLK